MIRRWTFLLLLLGSVMPHSASAHSRGTSYSEWVIGSTGVDVSVRVSQLELSRLQLNPSLTPDYLERVFSVLSEDIQLWSSTGRCQAGRVSGTAIETGWIVAHWTLRCPDQKALSIRSNLFLTVAPSHLHFARVEFSGSLPIERLLTYSEPFFKLADPQDTSGSFARYLKLGIEHILSGWDHLSFVLALILLAASLREVALVATGFTLAHSLTLAAAVLGWVHVQAETIEALIGFSIALLAAENLWQRSGHERWVPWLFVLSLLVMMMLGVTRMSWPVLMGLALFTISYFALAIRSAQPVRLRITVAFIFGLIHGFGFAGAMTQLDLPAERLATGLLGFNTGVELGQLLVIASVWPLLKWLERQPRVRHWAGDAVSACICALGTFWFLTRALA